VTRPDDDDDRNGDVWDRRADAVRNAFLRAYNSYVTYAAPYDELLPLSKAPMDTCVLLYLMARAQLTLEVRARVALMAGRSRI
jgi:hypothetical protein